MGLKIVRAIVNEKANGDLGFRLFYSSDTATKNADTWVHEHLKIQGKSLLAVGSQYWLKPGRNGIHWLYTQDLSTKQFQPSHGNLHECSTMWVPEVYETISKALDRYVLNIRHGVISGYLGDRMSIVSKLNCVRYPLVRFMGNKHNRISALLGKHILCRASSFDELYHLVLGADRTREDEIALPDNAELWPLVKYLRELLGLPLALQIANSEGVLNQEHHGKRIFDLLKEMMHHYDGLHLARMLVEQVPNTSFSWANLANYRESLTKLGKDVIWPMQPSVTVLHEVLKKQFIKAMEEKNMRRILEW